MQTAVLGCEADLQAAKTTAVVQTFSLESWIKRPRLILVANGHRGDQHPQGLSSTTSALTSQFQLPHEQTNVPRLKTTKQTKINFLCV